jgi:hypothetical protein
MANIDHDDGCTDAGCGCHSASFSPSDVQHCPQCGKRLKVFGLARAVKYRLACSGCGYMSDILSRDEVHDIL